MSNKDNLLETYIGWGIVFAFVCFLFFQYQPEQLNNIVLLGTGIIILFYTYFTHGLRNETEEQNELNIRPILVPFFRNDVNGIGWHLVISNIGKGVAVDLGLDIQSKIYNDLFPVSRLGDQEERIFAPESDEKKIKFVMDDHVPKTNDSYAISLDRPDKISEQNRGKFSDWAESQAWVMNFYYHDVNGRKWHTFARKKKNEFVVHDLKINK